MQKVFLLLRGRFSRSICPKLYGDSYTSHQHQSPLPCTFCLLLYNSEFSL